LLPSRKGFFELAPSGRCKSQAPLSAVGRAIGLDPPIALEACNTAGQGRVLEAERFSECSDWSRTAERQSDQHRELGAAQAVRAQLVVEETGNRPRSAACGKTVAGRAERQVEAEGHGN